MAVAHVRFVTAICRVVVTLVLTLVSACTSDAACAGVHGGAYDVRWSAAPEGCPAAEGLVRFYVGGPCWESVDGDCGLVIEDGLGCGHGIPGGFAWLRSTTALAQTGEGRFEGEVVFSHSGFGDRQGLAARQECATASIVLVRRDEPSMTGAPPQYPVGATCSMHDLCISGAYCNAARVCQREPSSGESCATDLSNCVTHPCSDCGHVPCCASGTFCGEPGVTGIRTCKPDLGIGDVCRPRLGTNLAIYDHCTRGLQCSCSEPGCEGTCVERL